MTDDPVAEVPELVGLKDAAARCGVPTSVLKHLAEHQQFRGATRGPRGHVMFHREQIPTWHQVVDLIEEALTDELRRAKHAPARVKREIEAVDNDIDMALENPRDRFGEDLDAFSPFQLHAGSTLQAALQRLNSAKMSASLHQRALTDALYYVPKS